MMLWGAEKLVPVEYWCPYGTVYLKFNVETLSVDLVIMISIV